MAVGCRLVAPGGGTTAVGGYEKSALTTSRGGAPNSQDPTVPYSPESAFSIRETPSRIRSIEVA